VNILYFKTSFRRP